MADVLGPYLKYSDILVLQYPVLTSYVHARLTKYAKSLIFQ